MVEKRQSDDGSGGFTLLELLIAITILGLILVAATSGVHFAGRAWDVQERRSDRQGDVDAVQSVLRNVIASARDFDGTAGSLRFVSTLPAALDRGGLYDVELRASANRLLLAWKPHFKGPTESASPTEIELIKDVAGFELAYYVRQHGWQRALSGEIKQRPLLVRLDVKHRDGQAWPPLIIAPAIDGSPRTTN